ncbi:MAG: S-layer homology domain-containing protein [Chloroflexota bacterium]|nr:S-layer homology domain-containing protein [Chloroflexota bacterium]
MYFCWAATRQLAPAHPQWAVVAAAGVALLPQFGFNSATAGNDSAVLCWGMAAFYTWFRALRDPRFDRWGWRMGGLCGLAILSKLSGLVLLPGLALVIALRAGGQTRPTGSNDGAGRAALRLATGAGLALLLLCGPWILRNLWLYGEPTGTAAIFHFYQGKFGALHLADATSRAVFVLTTRFSFVGVFGWMNVPLPPAAYTQADYVAVVLLGLSTVAVLRRVPLAARLRQAAVIMALVTITLLVTYIQFNVTVGSQAQGRYLFLALLPFALLATAGLYTLSPRGRWRTLALSALLIWLAVLDTTSLALVHYTYDGGDDPQLPPPRTTVSRGAVLTTLVQRFAVPPYQPGGAATFSDVPPDDPRFAVAETAHHAGIISGYACGGLNEPCNTTQQPALRPDNAVNRQQFAQLLVAAAGWPVQSPVLPTFADVPVKSTFYPAIETAVYHGALHGYPCGLPGEPCDDQHRPYFRPRFNLRQDDSMAALAAP